MHIPSVAQFPKLVLFIFWLQKHLVSIIEGLCKGHGCLDRSEITTFTAILKSLSQTGGTSTDVTGEQESNKGATQDDFFQRLQAAFTEGSSNHSSCKDKKGRYCRSWSNFEYTWGEFKNTGSIIPLSNARSPPSPIVDTSPPSCIGPSLVFHAYNLLVYPPPSPNNQKLPTTVLFHNYSIKKIVMSLCLLFKLPYIFYTNFLSHDCWLTTACYAYKCFDQYCIISPLL